MDLVVHDIPPVDVASRPIEPPIAAALQMAGQPLAAGAIHEASILVAPETGRNALVSKVVANGWIFG